MYHLFHSDGTYSVQAHWPRSKEMTPGDHVYVLQVVGERQSWYLNRPRIGPIPVNISDVPEQYLKFMKMLNLVYPKE